MSTVLVLLQNAWSEMYAPGPWPRESWLKALHRSRSGQRLRVFEAELSGFDVWYDNSTPEVAAHSSGKLPPDEEHIERLLKTLTPKIAVLCGVQAMGWSLRCDCPVVCMPHPAYRVVTNKLLAAAGRAVMYLAEHPRRGKITVKQGLGAIYLTHEWQER